MKLHDLQYYGDANNAMWLKMIADMTIQWNEKKMDDAHYHSQLSLCYGSMFMSEECKKHAALVPDSARAQEKTEALTSVARMLVYEKKIKEALDCYQQAYALDNEHEVAIEEAGWCCCELKQWEQAQDWFIKGTILMDDYEPFWEGLGLSLGKQEKFAEALPAFKKALELCDKDLDGYRYNDMIGQCYGEIGDFYRALGHYTKSLDANPTYANALHDMAALYFNHEGDMTTAIHYLKKAEAVAEKDGNDVLLQLIYFSLAKIYNKQKEFKLYDLYQEKAMEKLGFGGLFGFESDDDDDEEEEEF